MNEINLKEIWNTDNSAPKIDFAELQKTMNVWHDKLGRKVKIDILLQVIVAVLVFVSAFFYPRFIFYALFMLVLGIWYVPELRKLYKRENDEIGSVKESLNAKISTMESYFWRTRIAMYVFIPFSIPAFFYGFGDLNGLLNSTERWIIWIILFVIFLIVFEILIVIVTEIYFKILYTPALNELKNLLQQLDSEE